MNRTIEQIILLILILVSFSMFYNVVNNTTLSMRKMKKLRYIMEKLDDFKEKMIISGETTVNSSNVTVCETILDERDGFRLKKIELRYRDGEMERELEFLMLEGSK